MRTKCIVAVCVALLVGTLAQSACALGVRPYLKLGYLLNGPSADDLDFVLVGGGNLDQFLDVNKTNFGAGVQFFPIESSSMLSGFAVRLGFDAGVQRLFTSEFQSDPSNLHWKTSETALGFLGVVELTPAKMSVPVFLQAGLGLDFVLWSDKADLHGVSDPDAGDSGMGTNLAVMVAGGVGIPVGPTASIPIMLRLDNVFRYGSLTTISAMVGLNVKL
jgi:hypothetical protein